MRACSRWWSPPIRREARSHISRRRCRTRPLHDWGVAARATIRSRTPNRFRARQGDAGDRPDLAPLVDLMPEGKIHVDWNTRIATRSIAHDPSAVAAVATGFSWGLLDAGITPTAKHFPGLSRVAVDTHLFAAALDAAEPDLQAVDWVPFRAVLGIPGAAIMLSHVALTAADAGTPVSQSKRVVTDLLRDQWGFDGIAITDDLTMGAVEQAGLCHAVVGALNAGVDLLLVSWDTDKAYPALRCALDAFAAGRLNRQMLERSAQRLDRLTATKPGSADLNRAGAR